MVFAVFRLIAVSPSALTPPSQSSKAPAAPSAITTPGVTVIYQCIELGPLTCIYLMSWSAICRDDVTVICAAGGSAVNINHRQ